VRAHIFVVAAKDIKLFFFATVAAKKKARVFFLGNFFRLIYYLEI
jgi:hypothetical protein